MECDVVKITECERIFMIILLCCAFALIITSNAVSMSTFKLITERKRSWFLWLCFSPSFNVQFPMVYSKFEIFLFVGWKSISAHVSVYILFYYFEWEFFFLDLPNYPKMNLIVLRFMILSGSTSAKSSSSVCSVRFSISLKFYGLVSGNNHENNLISMKLLVNSWASFHWKNGGDFRFYHVAITLRLWCKIHSRKIHCREKKKRMKKNSISQTFWDQINELAQLKLD